MSRRRPAWLPVFFPPLPEGMWRRAVYLSLVAVGVTGTFFFFPASIAGPVDGAILAGVLAANHALACSEASSRVGRVARGAARAVDGGVLLFALYEAPAWASVLGWAVPWAVTAVALALVAGAAWTHRPKYRGVRVPLVLPLGILAAASLVGWAHEETQLRCDDVLRVRTSRRARIVVPSHEGEALCEPGQVLGLGHFPRKIWEAPGGEWVVFTTQAAIHHAARTRPAEGRLTGPICGAVPGSDEPPQCLLERGKGQNLVEDPAGDRLFVGLLGGLGDRLGGIMVVTRSPPLRELARVAQSHGGSLFVDATFDLVGSFDDEGRTMFRNHATDLALWAEDPELPASFMGPDTMRFDPRTHRGLACTAAGPLRSIDGTASLAIAFQSHPWQPRLLGPSDQYPTSWLALSWGCDWDRSRRRAFVAVASLGQLVVLDYDTGEVLERHFVELGLRTLAYDEARGVAYMSNFLRGDVLAVDVETGDVRWRAFVGRFVRDLVVSRDGRGLLATSNLGVVRVALD